MRASGSERRATMMKSALIGLATLLALACEAPAAAQDGPQFHRRPGSQAPFSASVRVGNVLYLSGVIGLNHDGSVPDTIAEQVRISVETMRSILALTGNDLDDVFRCTILMKDVERWMEFEQAFVPHFHPDRLPVQTIAGASGLVFGAAFEVECLAYAGSDERR
jgi:enamine deaminase RidA (YjgF/YER057c/UK114 family)